MKLRDHCKELENLLKLKERENGKLRSEIKKAWDEKNATKRAKKKVGGVLDVLGSGCLIGWFEVE